jgi:hypothetical protein
MRCAGTLLSSLGYPSPICTQLIHMTIGKGTQSLSEEHVHCEPCSVPLSEADRNFQASGKLSATSIDLCFTKRLPYLTIRLTRYCW